MMGRRGDCQEETRKAEAKERMMGGKFSLRTLVLAAIGVTLTAAGCRAPAVSTDVAGGGTEATAPQVSAPATMPATLGTATSEPRELVAAREELVQTGIIGWGITDAAVIEVMRKVPRHEFVPTELLDMAYANQALPIGYGQTISQPYIVAWMTQELSVHGQDKVLEIGTGSGYQAAVLAELGVQVYSIEIVKPLAEAAAARLARLGYAQVHTRYADGYYGWEEAAPFDAIIVTAAPDHVPQPLLGQLRVGGVMVIPVGPVGGYQELWRITRTGEDSFESNSLGGVQFVPLTRTQ